MAFKVKLYIGFVIALGSAAFVATIIPWPTDSWVGFLVYVGLSVLASGFKIRLPGITGTLSAAFPLTLTGIVCLRLPEALVGACAAVTLQSIWHSHTVRWVKVLFNVASMATAVTCSGLIFHCQWLQDLHLEFAIRLAILGCVYFLANTLPVAGVIALTEGKPILSVWQGSYFWSLLHYLVASAIAGLFYLTRTHLGWQTALLLIPVTGLIYRACSLHLGRLEDARKHAEETSALHLRTITSLALTIQAKDEETHDHLRRVQVYAVEIGKELGLEANELEALRAAALLHDIGKIAVPDQILRKPGKLTREEFSRMKIHPVVGADILERACFPFAVAPIVRSHHEKWDGSGYPSGLKGEEIPIGARILSAVDCLDALASDRHYRAAMPLTDAVAAIAAESGRSFDPRIVAILKRRYAELEQMARCAPVEPWRLTTDLVIERGAAPGAGFADGGSGPEVAGISAPSRISDLVGPESLLQAANSGESCLSLQETLSIFRERLVRTVPFESMAIYVRHGNVLVAAYAGGSDRATLAALDIPIGEGVAGRAAASNCPLISENPDFESPYFTGSLHSNRPASTLAVPLPGDQGAVGVLALYSSRQNTFRKDDQQLLVGFAPELGRYLRKASAEVQCAIAQRIRPAGDTSFNRRPDSPTQGSVAVH